ncbi:MAG: hypothetical protein Rpha_1245 [Candidatus Ruthia sp. Apha_13_S6]|nr:hypothetical protein [Candidatus Ruthia sp. Apha_13_S6]
MMNDKIEATGKQRRPDENNITGDTGVNGKTGNLSKFKKI